jgi:Tfp pilus assembly protein PilN
LPLQNRTRYSHEAADPERRIARELLRSGARVLQRTFRSGARISCTLHQTGSAAVCREEFFVINLLQPDLKSDYRYARRNRHLVHWVVAFVLVVLGVAVITGFGLFAMQKSINSYNKQVATEQAQLKSNHASEVQKQVAGISNNLKLMVKVLSKEILFSDLLTRLGQVTPSNAILTNLTISQTQSAIDITAQTTNYNAATQLQVNLADPDNQIFSKADIVSINCASGPQAGSSAYPCTTNIRAQFTNNNPFLFINSQKAGH